MWKRGLNDLGQVTYLSTHHLESVNGRNVPMWLIIKEPKGYMLYTASRTGYKRLVTFMHRKTLKEVKYYCDVEYVNFLNQR